VKGNRYVYHGQNDRATLLNHFLDVKDYIGDMFKDEQLRASVAQVKFLQKKSSAASPSSVQEPEFSLALLKLQEFMPPKPYCDRLVAVYFQHFERTMRVLHTPSFMRQYDQIWIQANSDMYTSSSIIPTATAIMTMAYHMDDPDQSNDNLTHRTYLKNAAIDLVQAWLDELPRKQRTELSTLQVETLVLLSKSLRGLHPEKLWCSTGALVRSAMVLGLHIDNATTAQIPPFQAEMRRRLWATVLEIDLQASMATGMPLVVPELGAASSVPSNLDDSTFDESSTSLPASRSMDTYTDNLYQVILASSLPQRLKALSLVQRSALNVQEATSVGRQVEECLLQKPQILSLHKNNDAYLDSGSVLHRVLLDLYLRRPLLCLYKPLLLQKLDPATSIDVQKHCVESSQVVLSYQDLYTISALTKITSSPWAHQDFFYRCCKQDVLWAALTLCQHIKLLRQGASAGGLDHALLVRIVEKTIQCLIDRIGQKGSDLKDIALISLALQSVQLFDSMPGRSQALQQAAKRTLAACRERLLQPLITSKALQPASDNKHKALVMSMATSMPNAMANPRLTPTSLSDLQFPLDLPENAEQWFGNLPDLAAEFSTFQADSYNPDDVLGFGITQDWNWEHMWQ
jgi:hypothetical protein